MAPVPSRTAPNLRKIGHASGGSGRPASARRRHSSTEAEEVFALRLKIEPEAAAAASLDADDPQRKAARTALAALEAASNVHATGTIVGLNRAFHLVLVRASERLVTARLVERLLVLAERYVRKHLEPEGRDVRADSEHREILDAWLACDAGKVALLLSEHIASTLDDVRLQLLLQDDGRPAAGPAGRRSPGRSPAAAPRQQRQARVLNGA